MLHGKQLPQNGAEFMRLLGIDYGDARVGIALSDPFGWTAAPLPCLSGKNKKELLRQIDRLVREHGVEKIVLGFPKNMNGTLGPQGEKVLKFCDLIKEETGLEIDFWDERLTTVAAERSLIEGDVSRKKRKKVIDMLAAVIILQGYLDSKSKF